MRRAVVVTNPNASRVDRGGLDAALLVLRRGGVHPVVHRTSERGHGERLAREALASGADLLIAHGGDGTIMEVASGMLGSRVPLGLLPAGTGNRLADNLGIPWTSREAAALILEARPRVLDLGRLTTSEGTRTFAVTAGCGFDADLMRRTGTAAKRELGVGAYLAAAMKMGNAIIQADVRVETDHGVRTSRAAMVLIANCGGIIPLASPMAPGIRPDDGWFDVLLIDAPTLGAAARIGMRLVMGEADRDEAVTMLRATRVAVTADPALPAQADGEMHGTTPLAAEIIPGGLTVLAPWRP